MRAEPLAPSTAIGSAGRSLLAQEPGAHRVVDVVVDVRDAIDDAHDPALERASASAPGWSAGQFRRGPAR